MLQTFRAIPDVAAALDGLSDDEVMRAIERRRTGQGVSEERPVKQAEFDVLNSGHAHIGRDDSNSSFFAGTVLRSEWDPSAEPTLAPIEKLVLVHRLREVIALIGFTRFEAVNPNTDGELDLGVERAALDLEPTWLPAVEHKGEGIFISFRQDRITAWLQNEHVKARELKLMRGFDAWCKVHKDTHRVFPGLPYILLHSLSHLLLTAIALECGYPASSLRERVYASDGQYGILIYTGSSDSEGTLGGLIEAGRHIGRHLTYALDLARLCLYRTRFFAHKAALCGLVGCDRCGDPVPPCFGWASIAVLFQEPVPVVPTEVRPDDGADLLDVLEDASENELLLERADEPLDDAVGLRLADEGEAGRHPEEPQLVLEVLGHERAAVVLSSTSRFAVFSTLTRAPSIRY